MTITMICEIVAVLATVVALILSITMYNNVRREIKRRKRISMHEARKLREEEERRKAYWEFFETSEGGDTKVIIKNPQASQRQAL